MQHHRIAPAKIVPKRGLIVWWDNCPPLDDDRDKRRPIIVVEPVTPKASKAIVVACSATACPREPDSVPLPNLKEQQNCLTGLPRPCCAVPRWFLEIDYATLAKCEYCGSLGGRKLHDVLEAYVLRRNAAHGS